MQPFHLIRALCYTDISHVQASYLLHLVVLSTTSFFISLNESAVSLAYTAMIRVIRDERLNLAKAKRVDWVRRNQVSSSEAKQNAHRKTESRLEKSEGPTTTTADTPHLFHGRAGPRGNDVGPENTIENQFEPFRDPVWNEPPAIHQLLQERNPLGVPFPVEPVHGCFTDFVADVAGTSVRHLEGAIDVV